MIDEKPEDPAEPKADPLIDYLTGRGPWKRTLETISVDVHRLPAGRPTSRAAGLVPRLLREARVVGVRPDRRLGTHRPAVRAVPRPRKRCRLAEEGERTRRRGDRRLRRPPRVDRQAGGGDARPDGALTRRPARARRCSGLLQIENTMKLGERP